VRFAVAKNEGFDEQRVRDIGASDFDDGSLDETDRLLLRYADCFLTHPASPEADLLERMKERFSDEQIVEMTAALALFSGFSKIAIALGPIPDNLPVMRMHMPGPAE
jgi:alkylhydroperoxidase family enzyme